MRRVAALIVLLAAAPMLRGQGVPGILTISPQQCVWHAGDNPAWAAANFDDSAWPSYAHWIPNPHQPSLWIHCRAGIAAMRTVPDPSIMVENSAAYEIFVDGQRIGGVGNLRTGFFDGTLANAWPLPSTLAASPAGISIHVVYRQASQWDPLALWSGSRAALLDWRDSQTFAHVRSAAPGVICIVVIGAFGLALLGFFFSDRSRFDILLLGLACVALSTIRLTGFGLSVGASVAVSFFWVRILNDLAQTVNPVATALFFFAITRRRIPRAFVAIVGAVVIWNLLVTLADLSPPALSLRATAVLFGVPVYPAVATLALVVEISAAWLAFFPLRHLAGRTQWLARVCIVWVAAACIWFAVEAISQFPGLPNLFASWRHLLADFIACTLLAVVVVLVALLLRDQRLIAHERSVLAGEMQAGREVQRHLVPLSLPSIPAFRCESAYVPAAEVGGDFYQALPQPGSSHLIVIGDVSGKGLKAAMTGSVVLGALRSLAQEALSPALILSRLNRQLASSSDGGFVTCLVVRITPDGSLTLANAGHLPPYRNGSEIDIPGSLPLGLNPNTDYSAITLQLAPGDTLTFLSDGVVEAQSPTGQLFGFDRTRAISTQSAEQIAHAAQTHGQQDDITVLTLTFAPAEALPA